MPLSQRATRRLAVVASLLTLLTLYLLHSSHDTLLSASAYTPLHPDCPSLPGLENTLVILKTGVTEAHAKLPIHRDTTLRCIPNYIVWSDYEEQIAGVPVYDVLSNTSATVIQHPDFDLYSRVRAQGREALTAADITDDASTPFGKPNNPGWKLDKWKFLPMISETLAWDRGRDESRKARADWYVFMEADTYLVWPTLMAWLGRLDARRAYYLGNQMQIGETVFAHGGSGFVLSRPAMERAAEEWRGNRSHWEAVTAENWAGDCVLGMLLQEAGVPLGWAWPMLQLAPPRELSQFDSRYGRTPWCYPPVSFHHVQPDEIRELWWLDRLWGAKGGAPLLYRDVYYELFRPRIEMGVIQGWDNLAGDETHSGVLDPDECRKLCEKERSCLQWTFSPAAGCGMATGARLGEQKPGAISGWMLDRIDARAEQMGRCTKTRWIV